MIDPTRPASQETGPIEAYQEAGAKLRLAMHTRERPICPHLPEAKRQMSHLDLTRQKKNSPEFYFAALQYGQFLWQQGIAGRAILATTRALYADLSADAEILKKWPLPYAALRWIIKHHASDDFPGNPRVSFQHQATRLKGRGAERRRARAWAVWALVRQARPGLPGDPDDPVTEPKPDEISRQLERHGHPGEAKLWRRIHGS